MTTGTAISSSRRARRAFWSLVLIAVLAAGSTSAALTADPGPGTGLRVAASGVILIAVVGLAARVLFAVERAHRVAHRLSASRASRPSSRRQR